MTYFKIKAYLVLCFLVCTGVQSGAAVVGKGSYADTLPAGLSAPPTAKYITANITGPVPTTKWYSSLISTAYSYSHYAYPLAMFVSNGTSYTGLQIGIPNVSTASDFITAPFKRDLEIRGYITGPARDLKASSVKVDAFSDWTVTPVWQDTTTSEYFQATYGHGLLFVYLTFSSGCNPKICFLNSLEKVFNDSGADITGTVVTDHLGLKYNDVYYGLFAPPGSTFTITSNQISVTLPADKRYFSIGLMTKSSDLAYFYEHAYAFVTDSKVSWAYNETTNDVVSTFSLTTTAKQGDQTTALVALLPHQYKNSSDPVSSAYTYTTLLGKMKLLEANIFTVTNKFHGVLPYLPDKGSYDKTHLADLLVKDKDSSLSKTDTYFNGKQIAKIANLIPIADQLQDTVTRDYLSNRLKPILTNWLTYSSGETTRFFYYDKIWGGLIGYDALFAGYNYSDHHYHFGYFVYAAALLSLYDSSFKKDYGPMVEYLIRDYANWQREDSQFPFLRTFDPYMGHSYCDGPAKSDDGNNQESSSEAMNAWAALILWGMVTNNNTIRDTGIYGYTTEYSVVHDYYFNIDKDIYSSVYAHPSVGILHDAKIEFATWWTGQVEAIHGIQMIPSTASMLYLGYYSDYCKINYDSFYQTNGGYEDYNEWYDILWKFQCFYDPDLAINKLNENVRIDTDGDSFTFLYHWIYNFKELGKIDISVHADTPYYAVFNKSGTRTYTAYNSEATTKKVSFYGPEYLGSIYVKPQSLAAAKGFACEVITISPSSMANSGQGTITIEGADFRSGLQVFLIRSGQPDVAAVVNYVNATKVLAEFDFTGLLPGDWALVVVNPGGDIDGSKNMPFTITGYSPTISMVLPARSSNNNQVRVQVTGVNFHSDFELKLNRSGEADIIATDTTYDSVTQVSGLLDIRNKTPGLWNVVVTNADAKTALLANGFEIILVDVVYVYPNPCKLSQNKKVYFTNVSRQAVLSIYDLTGDLVFSENNILANPYSWDLENTLGRRIASGIYLYVIQEGEALKTGKIAIIK
ncbi:MAG: T9SS type A sorting domain-containing protein [Elusimicrobia bacterium]|nr:T9SS type A sorting domain-containing protein [Elusimicrobiota bacterium]